MLILLLMFLPALPLPTGGLTHIVEIIALLLTLELVFGRRRAWLPRRWQTFRLSKMSQPKAIELIMRCVRWLQRFSRPRLAGTLRQGWFLRLTGCLTFIFILTAFSAPPFSGLDTLPSLGVVFIMLSLLLEDIVIYLLGVIIAIIGVALVVATGVAFVQAFKLFF